MRNFGLMLTTLLGFALVLAACGEKTGRVMDDDEATFVGSRQAGIEVFDQLIQETTSTLLDEVASKSRAEGKLKIAFVDIENKSAEELGDAKASSYDKIQAIVVNTDVFTLIGQRFVDAAMREAGMHSVDDMFTGKGRERFMLALGNQGITPDFALWGRFTTTTSKFEGGRQRDYSLKLELYNLQTGVVEATKTKSVSKEYRD